MRDCQRNLAESLWRYSIVFFLLVFLVGCSTMQNRPDEENPVVKEIIGIDAVSDNGSEEIVITSNAQLEEYSRVKQKTPLGLVFLFPETQLGDIPKETTPDSRLINSIAAATTSDGKNVRIEIGLNQDVDYGVLKDESELRVIFDQSASGSGDRTNETASTRTPAPVAENARYRDTENNNYNSDREPGDDKTGRPAVIRQLDFSAQNSGESAIIIGTSKQVRHEIKKIADRRLQLRLFNAFLPEHRKNRPLITTRFDSAVDRVSPLQTPGMKDTVDIIIELRQQVPYRTDKSNDQLVLHFEPSSIGPRPLSAANLPPWKKVLEESMDSIVPAGQDEKLKEASLDAILKDKDVSADYTGQKIALNFHETSVKNVFRIMQQISGKNYAIDPDVDGKVTISMEKPVPWDQVLELILRQNRLGMEEKGDIIRIATLETLDQEEKARQQQIQALKQRLEQEKTLEPLVTEYVPVNYANAQNEILPHIKDILSADRGRVSVDQRNNQLIITDVSEIIEKAKEIIARIDKVTPQVVIEARIVEVSDDFSREIGTAWSASRETESDSLDGQYGWDLAMNHPVSSASSLGFAFNKLPNMNDLILNARLTAMEENGEGKIISAPKIVTMDNKKAMITQGFEYPYQTVEDDNVQIEFKEIDLKLEVTPHVTPDSRIALQIFVTKNDIDRITEGGEPALSTNEARTELLVDDGDTIVIGGIIKENISTSEFGFPILKDIPLLGWLFKSKMSTNEKNELLIFITPRIIQLEQRGLAVTSR